MRTLMISIHPEWVERILNGDKTIEVRPWIPKGELPIKVLIYVTKGEPYLYSKWEREIDSNLYEKPDILNGKIVASFILNKAEEISYETDLYKDTKFQTKTLSADKLLKKSQLTQEEIFEYLYDKNERYAWHIDDLKIFEEPKELGDYGLTKAPQKMVWVEEL